MPSLRVLLASLPFLVACSTRKVDVMQGGHRMETLTARAEKDQGLWTMDMELPVGRGQVRLPEEPTTPRVVDRDGRPHARFELAEGRIHDGRPVRLTLQAVGATGEPEGPVYAYALSARFPGQGFIDFVFHLGGNASYKP
jgi:hypothetical protein